MTRQRRHAPSGQLAILLHTHMPYVEGFGTWPFGEEWLWEAIVGSYLPLLDLLDEGAPLTVSLTPVLCDQLEAAGLAERFEAFVDEVRRDTHARDVAGLRAGGHDTLARELERCWGEYETCLERFRERGGDLLAAFAPHAQWTSSATHAVLPLLASDAGVRAQVQIGVDAHRARFGDAWGGGFWLPECGHAPYLEPLLEEGGVRACCVELTNRTGLGSRDHARVLAGESGVALIPIDRATIARVWSDGGYPAHGSYRDYHNHTIHHHKPWSNDGAAYDPALAVATAQMHAAEFVASTLVRLEQLSAEGSDPLPGGGLLVCALDTELLGHWWYEGVHWLRAVVEECSRQGLALVRLDEAAALRDPAPVDNGDWGASTWGKDGDLSTWSGPAVADIAFATRAAELRVLAAGREAGPAALRELLALQASDWAFMVSRELAVPYARERFEGHRDRVACALAAGADADAGALRNLAPGAGARLLLGP
ncbi:MAG TPA: 1,4-alpha-glucan branching protein domain-containing protein [Solirubrobacteraceae bacterium]|nr:1,4-alpha-glucan branching protein domain-containing protein [Solirubrobacteraceae bacterium]